MQHDLDTNHPELDIQILGVNETGFEAGNELITLDRDIPWLQDVDGNGDSWSDVWTSWDVTYRDVIIVDAENTQVGVFNLTTYDLGVPENYDALRQTLIEAVPEPASLALLTIGIAGLLPHVWRRRKD